MDFPKELSYVDSHEWIKKDGDKMIIGITDFAQDALGDIVFINLPEVGDDVTAGEVFADVESVKAVSDIYSPVSGKIAAVNEALLDTPELINKAPYDTWLIEVEDVGDTLDFLSADDYLKFLESEA